MSTTICARRLSGTPFRSHGPLSSLRRALTTQTTTQAKPEGTIADAFASLSGQDFQPLAPRFATLKSELIRGREDAVLASWQRLLASLRVETARIAAQGSAAVPTIHFDELGAAPASFGAAFRERGVAVIRGALPAADALALKRSLRAYVARNPHTRCFPADRPAVYELYWSEAQVRARAHPRMLAAQRFVLSHWHSADAAAPVSLRTPIAYADRLRMRQPGDAAFALGPHVDGGSCERWEPAGYGGRGGVYDAVFRGEWEKLDLWEAGCRLPVTSDLYNGNGACSAFRAAQGWLSMSDVAPFEGTLLTNPLLKHATAYYLLRPFFTPRSPPPPPPPSMSGTSETGTTTAAAAADDAQFTESFLAPDNWELEERSTHGTWSSWLQGASPGCGQELRPALHPHLDLARTMVHVPRVAPGDYVVWHCDAVHAVDAVHRGAADSSVLYIPACPLTEGNARYLARQRDAFARGTPSPDMPGGVGEAGHVGRAGPAEVQAAGGAEAMRAMGLVGWDAQAEGVTAGEKEAMKRANEILGF